MVLNEHTKTGLRMGLGVFITSAVAFSVVLPAVGKHSKYTSAVFNAGKAASITTVVVNAPLMGRVTEVGLDRSLGTIFGGVAGYLVVCFHYEFLHRPNEAFWAAWGSVEAGWRIAKLETTPRLFTLTFLLVAFGSRKGDDISEDWVVLISRITGILFGVLVSLVLAVVVFPKSATQECLSHMRAALGSLLDLSEAAWPQHLHDFGAGIKRPDRSVEDHRTPFVTSSDRALKGLPVHLQVNKRCEQSLLAVFASLRRCIECGPLTKAEIYIGNIRGNLVFLPGLPLRWASCGGWALNLESLEGLENSLSRVSRLIWALHLAFEEGMSDAFSSIISQQYPQSLLPELRQSCQAALQDMFDAFANTDKATDTEHLNRFIRATEALLRISDYHRREMLHALRATRRRRPPPRAGMGFSVNPKPYQPPKTLLEEPGSSEPLIETSPKKSAESASERRASSAESIESEGHSVGSEQANGSCPSSSAFLNLPPGLDIEVGPSNAALARMPSSYRRQQSLEVQQGDGKDFLGSTHLRVKQVLPDDLLMFPETAEGLIAQVKWASFQFLAEELVEGLVDAHQNLKDLILSLPCSDIRL